MNSQTSMPSTSNQRLILSGKLKRTSKQITTLNSNLNPLINKKPFLKEYSNAMQQKLQSLKQKISQKKKEKTKQENSNILQKTQSSKLESFLKNKNPKKEQKLKNKILLKQQINQSQQQNEKIFEQFLQKNNLITYKNLLIQHQIDTLDILAEATQKQLQQIGIPKGHCLKLKVNIAKFLNNDKFLIKQVPNFKDKQITGNSYDKQFMEKKYRQIKTKDSQRNKSFVNIQTAEKRPLKQIQSISIGTQNEEGMENINLSQSPRSKFCLFCYQSIKKNTILQQARKQFCSQTCLQKYNQMFKKYENNLFNVQQQFKKSKNIPESQKLEQQKEENNQLENEENEWVDFLQADQNETDNFDFDEYNLLKRQLE